MATNLQKVFSNLSLPYCWNASLAFAISSFFRWASLAASSFEDDLAADGGEPAELASLVIEVSGRAEDGSVDACRGALSRSYDIESSGVSVS